MRCGKGVEGETTAQTREGLAYRLKEGATLEAMAADTTGDTKIGDGNPWTPRPTVTGGFYAIETEKQSPAPRHGFSLIMISEKFGRVIR